MPIYYDEKKIIPAPFCSINKEYQRAGDGQKIGSTFRITVTGKMLPDMGSPTSSGTFWTTSNYPPDEIHTEEEKMKSLLHKQEALRGLFAVDGRSFEIQPWDGSSPIKCRPRVVSVNFPEGQWFHVGDYTIELEADRLEGYLVGDEDNFTPYIRDAEENWSIEFADQPESVEQQATFRLTHSISAVGKRYFDDDGNLTKPAWQQARDWVIPKLGIDIERVTASGILNLPGYMRGYNHVRSENVDEMGGGYSVNETWIIASGAALEEFTIENRTSLETGLNTVSINGTITGLEVRNSGDFSITSTKYTNALAKFESIQSNLLTRAQSYANLGVSLNVEPLSLVIGKNPIAGVITYSTDYDDRPSRCFESLVANLKSETFTVSDFNPTDVFAVIPVLGRTEGPVLQDIGTVTEKKREVSVELVMKPSSSCSSEKPSVKEYIESNFKPTGSCIFKHQDQESWSPTQGRYSIQLGWTYQ